MAQSNTVSLYNWFNQSLSLSLLLSCLLSYWLGRQSSSFDFKHSPAFYLEDSHKKEREHLMLKWPASTILISEFLSFLLSFESLTQV